MDFQAGIFVYSFCYLPPDERKNAWKTAGSKLGTMLKKFPQDTSADFATFDGSKWRISP
jgi:hypothetical protein